MHIKLRHLLDRLKESLWFIPTLMALTAIGLSRAMLLVDKHLDEAGVDLPLWMFTGGAEGARAVLTTVASSMIAVAGLTFSITIVALTLASSQFGPRLLRSFMRDRGNQTVLGTFIATFLYCLLLLMQLRSTESALFVPHAAISVGLALTLASLGVLIYFIHHMATSIQASTVIELVGEDLDHTVTRFCEVGYGTPGHAASAGPAGEAGDDRLEDRFPEGAPGVATDRGGYVQALDLDGLVAAAREADAVVLLLRRPGQHVQEGEALARPTTAVSEAIAKRIQKAFVVGRQRTGEQDVEFAALQLVEVAVRALSPGINDPFTAIHCLDRLGLSVVRLARNPPAPLRHYDEDGKLRVVADFEVFRGFVDTCFDQIRRYATGEVAVLSRLLETLEAVARHTADEGRRACLREHAEMVWGVAKRSVDEPRDLASIEARRDAVLEALA